MNTAATATQPIPQARPAAIDRNTARISRAVPGTERKRLRGLDLQKRFALGENALPSGGKSEQNILAPEADVLIECNAKVGLLARKPRAAFVGEMHRRKERRVERGKVFDLPADLPMLAERGADEPVIGRIIIYVADGAVAVLVRAHARADRGFESGALRGRNAVLDLPPFKSKSAHAGVPFALMVKLYGRSLKSV